MGAIIVTGASGFIGRRLAARLQTVQPGSELLCLVKDKEDAFGGSGVEFLLSRSVRPVEVDIVCGSGLQGLPRPGVVFHLAANTHTWEGDHGCNDVGTRNLFRALGLLGPTNHVVFTSTTAVMDNRENLEGALGPLEMVVNKPLSLYGQSKWRAERFLRAESARQRFPLSIVRLCTVYGPEPRPNTLFDVLKQEVTRQTLASRLNWPGLTSFIHVDDVVSCLIEIGDTPPEPGQTRVHLLATESKTLAEVSALLYWAKGLAYRMVSLPKMTWRALQSVHWICRWGTNLLPARAFNALWRLNLIVNPVFHCDTTGTAKWLPNFKPRLMADCIHEI